MIDSFIDTTVNIEYGLLISIVLDAMILLVLSYVNKENKLNVLSYFIALALLIPLTIQISRLIGAYDLLNTTSAINSIVEGISPALSQYISGTDSHDIEWFIFRRILWSVIFIIIASVCIYVTMDKKKIRNRDIPNGANIGRRYSSNISRRRR